MQEFSDDEILAFSTTLDGASDTQSQENKQKKKKQKKKKHEKKKLEALPEMDETSAMLLYTQDVKEKVGVKDSYTKGKKSKKQKKEEEEAKKEIEAFEQEQEEQNEKK